MLHPKGWAIKVAGNKQYTKILLTQTDVIDTECDITKNQVSELVIHRENGQIREKNTYGNDIFPPKELCTGYGSLNEGSHTCSSNLNI